MIAENVLSVLLPAAFSLPRTMPGPWQALVNYLLNKWMGIKWDTASKDRTQRTVQGAYWCPWIFISFSWRCNKNRSLCLCRPQIHKGNNSPHTLAVQIIFHPHPNSRSRGRTHNRTHVAKLICCHQQCTGFIQHWLYDKCSVMCHRNSDKNGTPCPPKKLIV